MKSSMKLALAAALAAAIPAFAADSLPACGSMPGAQKMRESMGRMDGSMKRYSEAKDPQARQKALDDHMKEMHAGMGYMGGMGPKGMGGKDGKGCQMQMMDGMMNHMQQHRSAIQESGG